MYHKYTLPNKIRFIAVPLDNAKTVTILVLVKTGSKYETKKINGISHFLEHLFFKGTEKRPSKSDIAKELEQIGSEYNAFTSQEYTGFYIKTNPKHLNLGLDILSDMLLCSKFEEEEIKREKGVIVEEINMYQDTPMEYIDTLWHEILYGNQPAGWDVAGTKETVSSIMRSDIVKYYQEHYAPKNIIVCLSGDLKKEGYFDSRKYSSVITNYFSFQNFLSKANKKKKVNDQQTAPRILLKAKDTDQTHLMLGVRGYSLFHKDRFILKLLSIILGGGMSSRLFTEIREERGLAYYIYTRSDNDTDAGYLATGAGLDNKKVEEAIKIIVSEYKKITKEPVGNDELNKAKEMLKGRMTLNLETSDEWANFYATQELLQDNILSLEEYFHEIDKVNSADLMRVAKDIFRNNKLNLAMIGPLKDGKKFEKILKF